MCIWVGGVSECVNACRDVIRVYLYFPEYVRVYVNNSNGGSGSKRVRRDEGGRGGGGGGNRGLRDEEEDEIDEERLLEVRGVVVGVVGVDINTRPPPTHLSHHLSPHLNPPRPKTKITTRRPAPPPPPSPARK